MKKSLQVILFLFFSLSPIYANEQLTVKIQDLDIELINCPAGEFYMGSPLDELGRNSKNEYEQYLAIMENDFYIGKYEVTQAIYKTVMGDNPSKNIGVNNPVERVNYYDALLFCKKLNSITVKIRPAGFVFSLPTEKQWEYACRAGVNTALNNGKQISQTKGKCEELEEIGWYKSNSETKTHGVGLKKPNNWGIYDMHGNVAEWCLDSFNGNNSAEKINKNTKCVIRGGSYFYEPERLRSASRGANSPESISSGFGFRIVLTRNNIVSLPKIDLPEPKEANSKPISLATIQELSSDTGKIELSNSPTKKVSVKDRKDNFSADNSSKKAETASSTKTFEKKAEATTTVKLEKIAEAIATSVITDKVSETASSTSIPEKNIESVVNNNISKTEPKIEYKVKKEIVIKSGEKISISTNGVKFPLIGCSAGEFYMGSPNNELGRDNEESLHKVKITNGFYIGKYEITQGQYKAIMENNPSLQTGDKLPVHNINYFDAKNFCKTLNELTKDKRPENYEFALPTEEEWEYACRSGYETSLNNGKNLQEPNSSDNELNKIAWYSANSYEKIQTVGKRTANAWGIHDMLGNVWELCEINEVGSSNNSNFKMIRGGSFKSKPSDCRNARRRSIDTYRTDEDLGFRIVLKLIK